MNSTCDQYTTDIISLKRPTALDRLADSIAKPKGSIPNFGLPKWKVMPLESKIPMVPGPEGAYNFARRKIGRRLWISAPDAEFNLSDPYGYEIKLAYDSLHDKHLVPYFSRPNIIRHLIKSGFITKNLDAKCSLRDYNMYRKYLRRLHCDSVKKELNRRTKQSIEQRALQYAQKQAEKEVKKLNEKERLLELRRSLIKERKLAEKLKLQKQKDKQKKIEERLQALIVKKREAQHLRYIKSKERAELIQQKQKAAADIRRQRIIQTLLEWSKKEKIRKRMMEMRLADERGQKRKNVEEKWQERQEFQKKQIEKEQFLLQCIEEQRKEFIETYKEKVNKETERMKKLFEDVKMYIKCYLVRHLPGNKERICCEKYFDDDDEAEIVSLPMKSDKESQDKHKIKKPFYTKKRRSKEKSISKAKLNQETRKKKRKMQSKTGKNEIDRMQNIRKRRKQKRIKKVKKREDTESETKSELEAIPDSIPSTKTETSEAPTISEPKNKCRCQIIKDSKKIPM